MLDLVEQFSHDHEHSMALLESVGTVLAALATVAVVIVSLHLARRSESVRVKASLSVSVHVANDGNSVQWATIQITNVGLRTTWLPTLFFEWTIPLRKKQQPQTLANWINVMYRGHPHREIKVGGPSTVIALADMVTFKNKVGSELFEIYKGTKWFKGQG